MVQRAMESIVVAAASAVSSVPTDFGRHREGADRQKSIRAAGRDDAGRAVEVAERAATCGRSTEYGLRYDYGGSPELLSWQQIAGDVTGRTDVCYFFADAPVPFDVSTVASELDFALAVAALQLIRRGATRTPRQSLVDLESRIEALS